MKIELKSIKFYESMSEETNCFQADIFVDGKKVGYAKNQGHGGNTSYYAYDGNNLAIKKAEEFCEKLPKIVFDDFSMDNNLENTIDQLFETWLKAKDAKKNNAKFLKDCSKGICYGTPQEYRILFWKNYTFDMLLKHPNGRELIKKSIKDIQAKGGIILNTNIPKDLYHV